MNTWPDSPTATACGNVNVSLPARVICVPPANGTLTTRLFPLSAMMTSPDPATATPYGEESPVPTVVAQVVLAHPGGTFTTWLFDVSAMSTLPAPSTATLLGSFNPLHIRLLTPPAG